MSKNVFDLAQEDTSLKKESFKEYSGPCPRCGGSDRFRVQPNRKEYGAWMCRNCWDPALKGWGDNIEYLRQMRGMSFSEAKNYLNGEIDSLLERTERVKPLVEPTATGRNEPPNDKWQQWTKRYVERAVTRLLSSAAGKQGLDYLHSRGLNDATIKAAQLGYEEVDSIPYVIIPWHVGDGRYWRVNKRDIRPGIPHDQRYKNITGSSNAGLYGGELLTRKRATFLVEGELDALSIAQEAHDLPINVVATGGLDCSRVPRWVARLARVPSVLVAYDNEPKGEEASNTWLKILTHNALRYRPLAKDANAMLLQGWNIRTWIQGALDLLSEPVQTSSPELAELVDQEEPFLCSVCGLDLNRPDQDGKVDENGIAFCNTHFQALQQPAEQLTSKEQFQAIAQQLASVFPGECEISRIDPVGTYTLKDHVRAIEEQDQRAERDMWQARRKARAR